MGDSRKTWADEEDDRKEEAFIKARKQVQLEMDLLKRDYKALSDELRFQAACCAMQSLFMEKTKNQKEIAKLAVSMADALMEELKT